MFLRSDPGRSLYGRKVRPLALLSRWRTLLGLLRLWAWKARCGKRELDCVTQRQRPARGIADGGGVCHRFLRAVMRAASWSRPTRPWSSASTKAASRYISFFRPSPLRRLVPRRPHGRPPARSPPPPSPLLAHVPALLPSCHLSGMCADLAQPPSSSRAAHASASSRSLQTTSSAWAIKSDPRHRHRAPLLLSVLVPVAVAVAP